MKKTYNTLTQTSNQSSIHYSSIYPFALLLILLWIFSSPIAAQETSLNQSMPQPQVLSALYLYCPFAARISIDTMHINWQKEMQKEIQNERQNIMQNSQQATKTLTKNIRSQSDFLEIDYLQSGPHTLSITPYDSRYQPQFINLVFQEKQRQVIYSRNIPRQKTFALYPAYDPNEKWRLASRQKILFAQSNHWHAQYQGDLLFHSLLFKRGAQQWSLVNLPAHTQITARTLFYPFDLKSPKTTKRKPQIHPFRILSWHMSTYLNPDDPDSHHEAGLSGHWHSYLGHWGIVLRAGTHFNWQWHPQKDFQPLFSWPLHAGLRHSYGQGDFYAEVDLPGFSPSAPLHIRGSLSYHSPWGKWWHGGIRIFSEYLNSLSAGIGLEFALRKASPRLQITQEQYGLQAEYLNNTISPRPLLPQEAQEYAQEQKGRIPSLKDWEEIVRRSHYDFSDNWLNPAGYWLQQRMQKSLSQNPSATSASPELFFYWGGRKDPHQAKLAPIKSWNPLSYQRLPVRLIYRFPM
jgi:hypothetical protein